jgi:DNA-binding XRE family transcriptional regulator
MNSPKNEQPFKSLGIRLKGMREFRKESVAEVSGAVEIDTKTLVHIEQGTIRPSEDILLLLISHFSMQEDEATQLWDLAGYDESKVTSTHMINDDDGEPKSNVMVMPNDARVIYTDMVHVVVNNYGVVMNFMQGTGPNNQHLAISRIGMSKEHARSVIKVMQETLDKNEKLHSQKTLPPSNKSKDTKTQK